MGVLVNNAGMSPVYPDPSSVQEDLFENLANVRGDQTTDVKPGEMTVRQAVEDGGLTAHEGDLLLEQMRAAGREGTLFPTLVMYAACGTIV